MSQHGNLHGHSLFVYVDSLVYETHYGLLCQHLLQEFFSP